MRGTRGRPVEGMECRCGFGGPRRTDWHEPDAPAGVVLLQCPRCGDVYGDLGDGVDVGRAAVVFGSEVRRRGGVRSVTDGTPAPGVEVVVFADGSLYATDGNGDGAYAAAVAGDRVSLLSRAGVLPAG